MPLSGHVLLVDDEPAYQRLGASFLRQLGYRVSVAGDVEGALLAFASDPPHVVLLDLAMPPSMDPQAGLSLIPKFAQAVVVVLSGHGERDIALQAVERGVWDFLTKPIDPDVQRMVLPVLAHRILPNPEAKMKGISAERILVAVMENVPVPIRLS